MVVLWVLGRCLLFDARYWCPAARGRNDPQSCNSLVEVGIVMSRFVCGVLHVPSARVSFVLAMATTVRVCHVNEKG